MLTAYQYSLIVRLCTQQQISKKDLTTLPCELFGIFLNNSAASFAVFLATVCKNGSPYAIGPLSVLSVALAYCIQMVGWIKMPLGMEVDLGLSDTVLDGDPFPHLKGGGGTARPIFSPCLLWPNGWMDQEATSHGGRPRPRPHCVRWGPSSPTERGTPAPNFSAHVYCGQMVAHLSNC